MTEHDTRYEASAALRFDELMAKVSKVIDGESFHIILGMAGCIMDCCISMMEKDGYSREAIVDSIRQRLLKKDNGVAPTVN
jgi:hypothetical protein